MFSPIKCVSGKRAYEKEEDAEAVQALFKPNIKKEEEIEPESSIDEISDPSYEDKDFKKFATGREKTAKSPESKGTLKGTTIL